MKKTTRKPKQQLSAVNDELWTVALEAVEQGDLRELVRALRVVSPVPDWVREELSFSLAAFGKSPLKDSDKRLLLAAQDFRHRKGTQRFSRDDGRNDKLLTAVAEEHGVNKETLAQFLTGHGRVYRRVKAHIPSA